MNRIPAFDELTGRPDEGIPPGANWGLWGADDELGTLNFIDEDKVRAAAQLVRSGRTFTLGLGQNYFADRHIGHRGAARQEMTRSVVGHDDSFDNFFPQASSQWDALRHYGHPKWGFYNGVTAEAIQADPEVLSISRIAQRGVVTRGVLADVQGWATKQGRPIDCSTDSVITASDIEQCLADQGVTLERGDMLLVRTGWLAFQREHDGQSAPERWRFPGLDNDPSMARFLWDSQIAAVAGDNLAVEAAPGPGGRALHVQLIAFLGMPMGEFWDLDALAEDCAADGRYTFMISSVPVDLPGGCGSPTCAVAIK